MDTEPNLQLLLQLKIFAPLFKQ